MNALTLNTRKQKINFWRAGIKRQPISDNVFGLPEAACGLGEA